MTKPLWITHTSESRKPLFDGYFKPSMDRSGLTTDCDFLVHNFPYESVYGQEDFRKGVNVRAENVNRAVHDNPGRLIITSGDDLYIYGSSGAILDEIEIALRYVDLVAMQDNPESLCCCLMACRGSPTTKLLMHEWVRSAENWKDDTCDQHRFNRVIRNLGISFGRLPLTFWTHGRINGQRFIDDPSMLVDPPADILIHHANYAMETDCKVRLIEEIKLRRNKILLDKANQCK